MIGAPLALLGLLAVAVPIIIHLLGRHRSRVERFPTLRFIGHSRLNPTSRRRVSDWLLLLVRVGIVAVAALALSQPWVAWAGRVPNDPSVGAVTRVTIIDTSASTSPAIARHAADSLATGATVTIETGEPSRALEGAVAWLSSKSGMRELVLVSDFQRSSVDTAALSAIPSYIGLSFRLIPSEATDRGQAPDRGPAPGTFVGASDTRGADAAWRANGAARPTDTTNRVAIIYRSYPRSLELMQRSQRVDSLWMARIVARLQVDPTLRATAGEWRPDSARAALDTVATNIYAGRDSDRLLLFLRDDPGGIASAALSQALMRALSTAPPASEADTAIMTAAELARWQRSATDVRAGSTSASDGRWLWALCLGLIALETWMRRGR